MSNLDGLLSDRCLIYLFNFHFFLCVCLYVVLCLVPCVVCCVLCVVLCGRSAHSVRRRRVRDARRRDERVPLGAARTVGRDRADDQGIRPQTEVAHTHSRTTLLYTSYSLYSSLTTPPLNQCLCLSAYYYQLPATPLSLSSTSPLLYAPDWPVVDALSSLFSLLCASDLASWDQP